MLYITHYNPIPGWFEPSFLLVAHGLDIAREPSKQTQPGRSGPPEQTQRAIKNAASNGWYLLDEFAKWPVIQNWIKFAKWPDLLV